MKPPYELALAWRCKRYNALPYSGGILDQPHKLMRLMDKCYNTYEIFRQRYTAPDVVKWVDNNPEAYDHYVKVKLMLRKDGYR